MSVVAERSNLQPRVRKRTLAGENPGSVSTAAAEDLLVAEPILRAAQQRHADIPTYFQLRPPILDRKKTFVCLAALGVEYGASRPGIAVLLQIP